MLDVSAQEILRSSGQGLSHLVDRRAQSVRKLSRQTALQTTDENSFDLDSVRVAISPGKT